MWNQMRSGCVANLPVAASVADENWAITMAAHKKGSASTYFLFGGGLCLMSAWCA
jgi:hypothetical protein